MSLLSPPQSPDLQTQFQNAMSGVLRRPGRGKRRGQWVNSGGEFNNLTEEETYGRLRARQGGNSGSGPGGGLRSGGLGTPSGIDYVKRGMPVNGSITPDPVQATTAPPPVKPDPLASDIPSVLSRKIGSTDAENPAENKKEGGIEETAVPAPPNSVTVFGSPWGSQKKPAVTAAPPVLQKPAAQPFVPSAKVQLAQTMEDVKNFQSKDRSDAVSARAKAEIANQVNPTNSKDPNRFDNDPEFQKWRENDPDAIANREKEYRARAELVDFNGKTNRLKETAAKNMETNAVGADRGIMEGIVDKGMRFDPAASIAIGKERAAGLRGTKTARYEPGSFPKPPTDGSPQNFPPVLQRPAAAPIKAAGPQMVPPTVAPTAALMNGEAPKTNPFAQKPLDNRLTAGLVENKRKKFASKNPFV